MRLHTQALSGQLLCVVSVLVNIGQRANESGPLVVSRYGNLLCGSGGREQTSRIVKRNIVLKYHVNLYE